MLFSGRVFELVPFVEVHLHGESVPGDRVDRLLVIPSVQHRLESGRSTLRLVRATNVSAGLGLAPLTASLGLSTYVVIDRHFGMRAGIASGLALTWLAAFAWFGLELLIGSSTGGTQMETPRTPLATKID